MLGRGLGIVRSRTQVLGVVAARLGMALAGLLLLAGCQGSAGDAARLADASDGADWAGYGRTYGEQHFSPLNEINAGTVGQLGLAWSMPLGAGNAASVPLAVDGTLYVITGLSIVQAVDAVTGNVKWTYDPAAGEADPVKLRQGWGNRGLAYWGGKIFTATRDGRLIAVDAITGKKVWSVMTVDPKDGRYITGAPRAFDGKVLIGHGGSDSAATRGYVTTYDAKTGKELWRFFIVPGNPANGFEDEAQSMAATTWAGEWWNYGGGGAAWNSFTYDEKTHSILIGTGNGAPWNRKIRSEDKGDNLFLCSIVALDADTGKYRWHYQVNPGETWDYNAVMDMHLADIEIGGKMRHVVMQAPKNGFFYVIDATNGEFISAEPIAKVTWAKGIDTKTGRPIEVDGARFPNGSTFELWPASAGAHSWTPSAFSRQTGLAYIPIMERGAIYTDEGIDLKNFKHRPGNLYSFGVRIGEAAPHPLSNTGWLVAVDPATQQVRWRVRNDSMWNSGVLALGSKLLVQGEGGGALNILDATTGEQVWSYETYAPILSAPITYMAGGKQYISVMVGMGGSAEAYGAYQALTPPYRSDGKRLLTFAIGGKAKLTKPAEINQTVFDDPDYRPDAKLALFGLKTYGYTCGICHGGGAISAGGAPDLRMSTIVPDAQAFRSVVAEGALVSNGMPRFDNFSDEELNAIRFYIRSKAAEARQAAK